jgi:hypothetical protein
MQLPGRYKVIDVVRGFAIVLDQQGHKLAVVPANIVNPVIKVPLPFNGKTSKAISNVVAWTSSVPAAYKAAKAASEGPFTSTPIVVLIEVNNRWYACTAQAESGRLVVTPLPEGLERTEEKGGLSGHYRARAWFGSLRDATKHVARINAAVQAAHDAMTAANELVRQAYKGIPIRCAADVLRAQSGEPDNG